MFSSSYFLLIYLVQAKYRELQQYWDDQWWLNGFTLSKAIFLEVRIWETQECSKVWQHEGNTLDTKTPTLCHHYWRIYSRTVGFLLKNFNLVPCHSGLLNRGLETFRTGWTAHRMLSRTAVASSTQSELPGTAAMKREQFFKILFENFTL